MTDVGAASEVGMVVGFNEKSVCTWKNDFCNEGEFSESHKGKHSRPYVLDDEEYEGKALSWLLAQLVERSPRLQSVVGLNPTLGNSSSFL